MFAIKNDTRGKFLALVLEPENFERMRRGDLVSLRIQEYFPEVREDVTIWISYERDREGFKKAAEDGPEAAIKFLGRGYRNSAPDDGMAPKPLQERTKR